jgi:hypothetical protein
MGQAFSMLKGEEINEGIIFLKPTGLQEGFGFFYFFKNISHFSLLSFPPSAFLGM